MSGIETVQHIIHILRHRKMLGEFAGCIPTLFFVMYVIDAVNTGELEEAASALDKYTQLFELIQDDLTQTERDWCADILHVLKQGVKDHMVRG